jgi:hypothetical protein
MTIKKKEFLEQVQPDEIKLLIQEYYTIQDARIRANNQVRSLEQPTPVLPHIAETTKKNEALVKKVIAWWASVDPVCAWAQQFLGVGPIIPAGLRAGIDFTKPHASSILQYCGMTPAAMRKRGQKLNYNPDMKRLAWLAAKSFEMMQGRIGDNAGAPENTYVRLFVESVKQLTTRNENGDFADTAKELLSKSKGATAETKEIWKSGKLLPSHIKARARRKVAQVFLTHMHIVGHAHETGELPPDPWVFAHGGHDRGDYIPLPLPPEWLPTK